MATKIVDCIECGVKVEASKFASPKLTRCEWCKCESGRQGTGNRKAPRKPVKGTKEWAIGKLMAAIENHDRLMEALDKAFQDGKIGNGERYLYHTHQLHGHNFLYGMGTYTTPALYGAGKKKAKVSDYLYWAKKANETTDRLFDILVESGADLEWDAWLAGRLKIADRDLEEWVKKNEFDHVQDLMRSCDLEEDMAVLSICENYADEWGDHQRKYGHM